MNHPLLAQFCDGLAGSRAEFEPPLDTLTTLKMRTRFQGQVAKSGELTVAHKDFVVLPPPPQPPFDVLGVVLGGHADDGDAPGAAPGASPPARTASSPIRPSGRPANLRR